MNTQHVKTGAAVGTADAAGITVPAVQIRINNHLITYLKSLWIIFPIIAIRFIKDIKELLDYVEKINDGGDIQFEIDNQQH